MSLIFIATFSRLIFGTLLMFAILAAGSDLNAEEMAIGDLEYVDATMEECQDALESGTVLSREVRGDSLFVKIWNNGMYFSISIQKISFPNLTIACRAMSMVSARSK